MSATLKRGWCPGVLRPMRTGDGLLVRLRLTGGRFPPSTARLIADAALRYGNGNIDLSQRANLQLRGVSEVTLAPLTRMLDAAGLIDRDERSEAARNVIASPASDLDATALIDAHDWAVRVEQLLVELAASAPLPAKFGVLIDDGGAWPLDDAYADIRIEAVASAQRADFRIGVAGTRATATPVAIVAESDVLPCIRRLCLALLRACPEVRPKTGGDLERWLAAAGLTAASQTPHLRLVSVGGKLSRSVIMYPLFGRLSHQDLTELADCLGRKSRAFLRLTTKKGLIIGPLEADEQSRIEALAASNDRFIAPDSPLHRIVACVGAPACGNAGTDTRADALRLAKLAPNHETLHVSGCAKGCATRAAADIVLVAEGGLYKLGRKCKAGDLPADARRLTIAEIKRETAAFGDGLAHA